MDIRQYAKNSISLIEFERHFGISLICIYDLYNENMHMLFNDLQTTYVSIFLFFIAGID